MLKVFKLVDEIRTPQPATKGSACFDIEACFEHVKTVETYDSLNQKLEETPLNDKQFVLRAGCRALVPTGLIFDIPEGYSVRLHPRSGTAIKTGLTLANSQGVIDSDYYHEAYIGLWNVSRVDMLISQGNRIAQGELVKNEDLTIEVTKVRPEQTTDRKGGVGSTNDTSNDVPKKRGPGRPKGSKNKPKKKDAVEAVNA